MPLIGEPRRSRGLSVAALRCDLVCTSYSLDLDIYKLMRIPEHLGVKYPHIYNNRSTWSGTRTRTTTMVKGF